MRHSLRKLALLGLIGLLAVAFVAACGGEAEPDPTESPTNTPAPTSTPMPTPVPPTATPAPTTAPTVAPTPEPDAMPAIPAFEFSPDMRWGDLYRHTERVRAGVHQQRAGRSAGVCKGYAHFFGSCHRVIAGIDCRLPFPGDGLCTFPGVLHCGVAAAASRG